MREILGAVLIFLGLGAIPSSPQPELTPPMTATSQLKAPVAEFKSRITKKSFGAYVTPKNSPVSPERFSGYHTGIDVEYEDVEQEVGVKSIDSGKIIYAGWISGYGGVVAQKINFNNTDYVVIYGHLAPRSLVKKGEQVKAGSKIGVLGKGHSMETDQERKHLHLAFVKGDKINWLGYVKTPEELDKWQNPLDFIE